VGVQVAVADARQSNIDSSKECSQCVYSSGIHIQQHARQGGLKPFLDLRAKYCTTRIGEPSVPHLLGTHVTGEIKVGNSIYYY
jgi:hypothetical protein